MLTVCPGAGTPLRPQAPGHSQIFVAISPATYVVGAGQTLQLTATVSGLTNPAVNWSLSPRVGGLSSSGLYTSPPVIDSPQVVIVTATSVMDPNQMASASIILDPEVAVSVSPPGASLVANQTQQFTPIVTGTPNPGVTWLLNPSSAGNISSSGLYTAPSTISAQQTVQLMATSVADPTKTAVVSIVLNPVIGVSVRPVQVALSVGLSYQFAANLSGTSNSGITWSLDPPVGTVSPSGLYTAPASIDFPQSVNVIASSVADPTKRAVAVVSLQPTVSVSLNVTCIPVATGQTQQFTAAVTGSLNPAVIWSVDPPIGTLSSTGLYTAPSVLPRTESVTVTAAAAADRSKSAHAAVLLLNAPSGGSSGGSCHWVELDWIPSVTAGVSGYNIYRSSQPGGPYSIVNGVPVLQNMYNDADVMSGQWYYYIARATDSVGDESANSEEAQAQVP